MILSNLILLIIVFYLDELNINIKKVVQVAQITFFNLKSHYYCSQDKV